MENLREKIKIEIIRIIKEERETGRFSILKEEEDVDLLVQIVITEGIAKKIKMDNFRSSEESIEKRVAELIFIAAPTGAGKDTLVRKISYNNPDKKYLILNMDIFRSYYPYFKQYLLQEYPNGLTDRTYAIQTNGFAYEIYYTMQRLVLENFPGTNIIITGTIREVDWVEETFKVFKADPYTKYTIKMYGLAVPKMVCAFSAIERYLNSIKIHNPGTARYVSSEYYRDTINNFIENFGYFEAMVNSSSGILDVIEVYKRSVRQSDFGEDTLLYSSDPLRNRNSIKRTAQQVLKDILESEEEIPLKQIAQALEIIDMFSSYLISQGLYEEILNAVHDFCPQIGTGNSSRDKKNITGAGVGGNDGECGRTPGFDD